MSEKPKYFITDPDNPGREKSKEDPFVDAEYSKEFLSSIKDILSEAGINISVVFETLLNEDFAYCNAYIGLSLELRKYMNYQGLDVMKRSYLDEDLFQLFNKPKETEDKLFFPSESYFKDLDVEITKAYREKVNFDVLLRYLHDPSLDQAKKNILIILLQIMDPESVVTEGNETEVPELSYFPRNLDACSSAEMHVLAYISGEHTNPTMGYLKIITNEGGEAIMLEKVGLGESYSCVTLVPIRLGGKYIPAGAILESKPNSRSLPEKKLNYGKGKKGPFDYCGSIKDYKGFKFVRFNIISVPEDIRSKSCGGYYRKQWRAKGYINYDWVTPEFIAQHANYCIKKYGPRKRFSFF